MAQQPRTDKAILFFFFLFTPRGNSLRCPTSAPNFPATLGSNLSRVQLGTDRRQECSTFFPPHTHTWHAPSAASEVTQARSCRSRLSTWRENTRMAPNFHASKKRFLNWIVLNYGFTCFGHLFLFFLFLGCVYFCPCGYQKKKEIRFLASLGFLYLSSRVLVGF